jgi:hypothetical protein
MLDRNRYAAGSDETNFELNTTLSSETFSETLLLSHLSLWSFATLLGLPAPLVGRHHHYHLPISVMMMMHPVLVQHLLHPVGRYATATPYAAMLLLMLIAIICI